MTALAILAAAIWAYLILLHGRFWSAGPLLPPTAARPETPVQVVIPARNEQDGVEATLRSLLAQDYPAFHITLVDDQSTDRTGDIARSITDPRLTIIPGQPRPPGWSGKLWALEQALPSPLPEREGPGVGRRGQHDLSTTPLILLTDADITHDPAHLATLVHHLEANGLVMASEMVELRCTSLAERALVPAFVFFFQLLYPFARVNRPGPTAAAAGGTILVRRDALAQIGGIAALKGALIDDVTLATRLKPLGPIYLGHTLQARSLRPYPGAADIWRMVARTAYVQLRFSPLILLGTVLGLALVWLAPPAMALLAHGPARWIALATWAASAATFLPTLRRFRQSPAWALALPAIAAFYLAATIGSALDHHRGRGVTWKQRAYRDVQA